LQVRFKDGLTLPAQSLSDGTLRFLGLAIIEEDSSGSRVICLEEPENGINPKKVYEIVELLQGMATDTEFAVDEDNPLRQVIVNTHSPIVVSVVPADSLYLAKSKEIYNDLFQKKISYTGFSALVHTWKTIQGIAETTSPGEILAYLDRAVTTEPNNIVLSEKTSGYNKSTLQTGHKKTVSEVITQYKLPINNSI